MRVLVLILILVINLTFNLKAQVFIANFPSGSLDKVELIDSTKIIKEKQDSTWQFNYKVYSKQDPYNPADPKLSPSARWYYFLIKGVANKQLSLNIINSDARRPFYSYNGKDFFRFSKSESPDGRSIIKKFINDSVYIAYFPPYTISYLDSRIDSWKKHEYVQVSSIGKSEHNRNMPLLTITNTLSNKKNKKIVYIHGRIHPSETPASWHLDEMIEILSSNNTYAKALRDNCIFYIVPFTNPDGVEEGRSRSNGEGINLEVNWDNDENLTSKEVKNIRNFLENKEIDLFLNMHSQSSDFVTYWVHTAESTSKSYYKELMLFSKLTINDNPHFYKNDLSFSAVAPRYLEGWFWNRDREKTLALCFETPYTYYNRNEEGEWVSINSLKNMAINNLYAIGDYFGISSTDRIIANKKAGRMLKVCKDLDYIYNGKKFYMAKKENAMVKYKINNLEKGTYDLYYWSVGKNEKISEDGKNCWVKFNTINIDNSSKLRIIRTLQKDMNADNILLKKQETSR